MRPSINVPWESVFICQFDTGYYNPLMAYGEEKAIHDAFEAGANGFIMVDLPPEEAIVFRDRCTKAKCVC